MSWFKLKEKILFLSQAKNAHGLHSPFVFNFYNSIKEQAKKGDYSSNNSNGFSKNENRIVLAIIQYFKPVNALILSDKEQIENNWNSILAGKSQVFYAQNLNRLPLEPINFNLIVLSKSLLINSREVVDKILPLISNESFVIIPHIHASKNAINQWKSLIEEKPIRVSMDLFFIGVLFFRKESTKQHFLLRF